MVDYKKICDSGSLIFLSGLLICLCCQENKGSLTNNKQLISCYIFKLSSHENVIVRSSRCKTMLDIIAKGGVKSDDGIDDYVFSFFTCDSIIFDGSYSSQANIIYLTDYTNRVVKHFQLSSEFRKVFDSAFAYGVSTKSISIRIPESINLIDIKKDLCSIGAFIKPAKVDGADMNSVRIFDVAIPYDKMGDSSVLAKIKGQGVDIKDFH
jgi:hypothetical protein